MPGWRPPCARANRRKQTGRWHLCVSNWRLCRTAASRKMSSNTSASMLRSLANAALLAESELNHAQKMQQQAAVTVSQAMAVVAHAKTQLNIVDDFRERELGTYRKEQRSQEENTRQDTNSRRRQRSTTAGPQSWVDATAIHRRGIGCANSRPKQFRNRKRDS